MQIRQTGGDGADFVTPSATGSVDQGRRPYRLIAVLTAVMMVFGGLALMPTSAAAQDQQVTTANLNYRTAPSLDAEIFDVIPAGTTVVVNESAGNGYYAVQYAGMTGFAHGDYLAAAGAVSAPVAPVAATGNGIVDIIYAAASMYGQSGDDLLRVAQCESGLNPSAVNASSNASGLFQFLPSTWATTPYAGANIFDPAANAEAAAWMWANGRRGEWVCQ